MFDTGFYIFLYLLTGACRAGAYFSEEPEDMPAWLYPPSNIKFLLIAWLWPFIIAFDVAINGTMSRKSSVDSLKKEARFLITMLLVFGVAVIAYYFASLITSVLWLRISLAGAFSLIIQRFLSKMSGYK